MSKVSFLKNINKLFLGNLFSQIIVFLTIPIVTRIFDPAQFGVAAIFTSLCLIIASISSFSYNQSIVLPKKDTDADTICILSFFVTCIYSIIVLVLVVAFKDLISKLLKSNEIMFFLVFLPIAVFSRGIYLILLFDTSRRKLFGIQSISAIIRSITDRIIIIGGGLIIGPITGVIIASRIISSFFELSLFLYRIPQILKIINKETFQNAKKLALQYKDFPLFFAPNLVLTNVIEHIPIFLFSYFFSPQIAGLYAMSDRLMKTPMQLIGNSFRRVYYQNLTEDNHKGQDPCNFFEKLRERIFAYSFYPILVFFILCDPLFNNLLGSNWEDVGIYAGILGFLAFAQLFSLPIGSIAIVFEKQKILLFFSIIKFVIRVVCITVGSFWRSPILSLSLFCAAEILLFISMNYWIDAVIGTKSKRIHSLCFKFILPTLALTVPIWSLKNYLTESPLIIITACLFSSALYYSIALYMIDDLKFMLQFFSKKIFSDHG